MDGKARDGQQENDSDETERCRTDVSRTRRLLRSEKLQTTPPSFSGYMADRTYSFLRARCRDGGPYLAASCLAQETGPIDRPFKGAVQVNAGRLNLRSLKSRASYLA